MITSMGAASLNKCVLNRDEAVLLIIDIQEKLVPAMKQGEQVIKNAYTLIATAQKLGIPIIATEQYPKGLGRTVPNLVNHLDPGSVFEKISFTGCIPDVLRSIKTLGRKKIIITGMETHVCVFQTVRDLLKEDYEAFIASDAVCSRTEANYLNGLSLMSSMGAVITNTETIFFDLLKRAGTPEFKELSRLVK